MYRVVTTLTPAVPNVLVTGRIDGPNIKDGKCIYLVRGFPLIINAATGRGGGVKFLVHFLLHITCKKGGGGPEKM